MSRIADDHASHPRDQLIVNPLRQRSFLQSHMNRAASGINHIEDVGRRRGHHIAPDHSSANITNGDTGACLVKIESYILDSHESALLSTSHLKSVNSKLLAVGRAFIMRYTDGTLELMNANSCG